MRHNHTCHALLTAIAFTTLLGPPAAHAQLTDAQIAALPQIALDHDNIQITTSCRIKPGTYEIQDADNNGVIHVTASDITIVFPEGQVELLGAPKGTPWNELTGTGIVITNASNVTITGAHVHRFHNGIIARRADGLTLTDCDVAGGYAMHLGSTPAAEDGADWLWPHRNDNDEWTSNYGAGIAVKNSSNVTISNCFARRRQNGIVLDRVSQSKVFDNDFSFLSGWGLAMWRCTDNVISRNAFDFCVRGYSHKVYNRGQDSAGILFFEQNINNTIAENSATHGGDGFFAFAGTEALGEALRNQWREKLRKETGRDNVDDLITYDPSTIAQYRRRGNRGNLLIANDFSDAVAHGVELTFSFDNRIINNTMRNNAICGIWGGYSQHTLIVRNTFENNGEMGYGLERGGINIEHGQHNIIDANRFAGNKVGVHLWWDPDDDFQSLPWARANGTQSAGNRITKNIFRDNEIDVQLRKAGPVSIVVNDPEELNVQTDQPDQVINRYRQPSNEIHHPRYTVYGTTQPVGARAGLVGRENIMMGEWFPWDHQSPLFRTIRQSGSEHVYQLLGTAPPTATTSTPGVKVQVTPINDNGSQITVTSDRPGAVPYNVLLHSADASQKLEPLTGTLINTKWNVSYFKWPAGKPGLPPPDLETWRARADQPGAKHALTEALDLKFAGGGPDDLLTALPSESPGADEPIGNDHFGVIARCSIPLTRGTWNIRTMSDDGVRVIARSPTLGVQIPIENWTWHGPTPNNGSITLDSDQTVEFTVEHFEIDGYSILQFSLTPADKPVQ